LIKSNTTILDDDNCRHVVQATTLSSSYPGLVDTTSLAELLDAEANKNGMPQYQRLHIAKLLVLAVLQFHMTPWLPRSLDGKEIYFVDAVKGADGQKGPSLPFVDVKVCHNLNDSRLDMSLAHVAPNIFMFRLGIMLLELAFNMPCRALRQQHGLIASLLDTNTTEFQDFC
jgi:hypothetical protein